MITNILKKVFGASHEREIKRVPLICLCAVFAAVGCTPARSTFAESWKAAVEHRDGQKAWELLDAGSRERIVAGLKRSQERAAHDPVFAAVFAAAAAPADSKLAPDALAAAILADEIGRSPITDDGATERIHVEDRKWRARFEPVGFVAPDGAPLTLALRLADAKVATPGADSGGGRSEEPAGTDGLSVSWSMKDAAGGDLSKMTVAERDEVLLGKGRLVKDRIVGFTFRPDIEGRTLLQIKEQCARAATRIAELGQKWSGFDIAAARVMGHYVGLLGKDGVNGYSFRIDEDGGLTPIVIKWSDAALHQVSEPQPRLALGGWPR